MRGLQSAAGSTEDSTNVVNINLGTGMAITLTVSICRFGRSQDTVLARCRPKINSISVYYGNESFRLLQEAN